MNKVIIKFLVKIISLLSNRNKLAVLTYHRVGEPKNQLCMDEKLFEQQLIWLKRYFNPVGLAEGLALQEKGVLPERSIAITIDDGYLDSYTTIFPLLKKHNLTATFFISTSGISQGYLWDELVSSAIMQLPSTVESFNYLDNSYSISTYNERIQCVKLISTLIKYNESTKRKVLIEQLFDQIGKPHLAHQFLTEQQIEILSEANMGIGAHTVNHPILACEDLLTAKTEIIQSKLYLEKITSKPIDFLAYPNGKYNIDFNDNHKKIAQECGFKAAFSTDWGCVSPQAKNRFSLSRFTPWDISEFKFNLRLALNFSDKYTRFIGK